VPLKKLLSNKLEMTSVVVAYAMRDRCGKRIMLVIEFRGMRSTSACAVSTRTVCILRDK
jgi:hypothetical protein